MAQNLNARLKPTGAELTCLPLLGRRYRLLRRRNVALQKLPRSNYEAHQTIQRTERGTSYLASTSLGLWGILAGLLLFPVAELFAQKTSEAGVAQRRAGHLRHGINLSEWFAQVYDQKGYTKEHFETWNTAQDVVLIKAMGFDHVRLSVNPQPMFRRKQADQIPGDYLGFLDAAVSGDYRYAPGFRL
jgi:hypothetical protein